MALQAVTPRRLGQRAPRDSTGQRGQSPPAASGSRAGRPPGPRPRLRGPLALIFVVLGVLLSVTAASTMPTGKDGVHQQLTAPQGWRQNFWELCPPGYHVSEGGKNCISCTNGVDFTNHWNMLPSCLPCTICKSGEEERTPCTATKDTQCQCKPGTFHEEDSPEFCQKCSTGCPDGMVVAKSCNPFSDLKCVDQKSGTQASGEAPVPGKTVTMRRRLPTTPSPSWGTSQLGIGIVAGIIAACVLLLALIAYVFWRFFVQGYGVDPKCMDRVFFWCSCPPRGPGALDNAHNNMLINRDLLSILVAKKDLEDQEQDKLTGVMVQSPVEEKHLLEPAEAEGSHTRRRLLVPANGADPTESLRLFFDYFATAVSPNSWDSLMRQLGLTRNEILLAREAVRVPRDALYEMLETWVSNKGREASVNTLLDALETLGERLAKQKIQDHLLESGKYVYEDGEAGSAVS
ncbi:tumor necrosis factor receptor superfamily member 10B [Physeter macrocephalus]|uniref:Tumor necrosis factor receptor superfamily member 10B n=1 Tax=Physeter macrocephalus TaxID=9755 RepID=A0A2Y9ELL9_PHYMC|nr:tumor necrosis factor receptor superfamily member 10B [Physeter catodon]|eukprot:XP_007104180.2 tumor necrosis factor receptor superfamily member 10B [Physeter catodon]